MSIVIRNTDVGTDDYNVRTAVQHDGFVFGMYLVRFMQCETREEAVKSVTRLGYMDVEMIPTPVQYAIREAAARLMTMDRYDVAYGLISAVLGGEHG